MVSETLQFPAPIGHGCGIFLIFTAHICRVVRNPHFFLPHIGRRFCNFLHFPPMYAELAETPALFFLLCIAWRPNPFIFRLSRYITLYTHARTRAYSSGRFEAIIAIVSQSSNSTKSYLNWDARQEWAVQAFAVRSNSCLFCCCCCCF